VEEEAAAAMASRQMHLLSPGRTVAVGTMLDLGPRGVQPSAICIRRGSLKVTFGRRQSFACSLKKGIQPLMSPWPA